MNITDWSAFWIALALVICAAFEHSALEEWIYYLNHKDDED